MEAFHYEEVSITEMTVEGGKLTFPCPCGDIFELRLEDLAAGADVAQCPTCSLTLKVLFTAEERQRILSRSETALTSATISA